jgi:hypothetical protein
VGNIRGFGTSQRQIRRTIERHRGLPNAGAQRLGRAHAETAAKIAKDRRKHEAEFLARKIALRVVPQEKTLRSPLRTLLAAARKIFGR